MCCPSKAEPPPARLWVCGPSNSGKTTLIEALIPRLRAHGLRVATVKHAHHGFELDHPGKDSWRHANAGASAVALVSPNRAAWFIETARELSCDNAVERISHAADLVLIEGFKRTAGPKILLEQHGGSRLTVNARCCRIAVLPDTLTESEWRQLVEFCRRRASTGARREPKRSAR
jgi:molybdopterin-guanine dinucleotide biosynthesis protein MobB